MNDFISKIFYIYLVMNTAEIRIDIGVRTEPKTVEAVVLVLTSIETGDTNGEEKEQVQTHAGTQNE